MSTLNFFRVVADILHVTGLSSIVIGMIYTSDVSTLSVRSLESGFVMFCFRYLPTFFSSLKHMDSFLHWYNLFGKIIFLSLYLSAIVYGRYLPRTQFSYSDDSKNWYPFIIILPIVFALIQHDRPEFFWAVSIFGEPLILLPQLFLIIKLMRVQLYVAFSFACLGAYRLFYILNWFYRGFPAEPWWYYFCGFVQELFLIGIVAVVFMLANKNGQRMQPKYNEDGEIAFSTYHGIGEENDETSSSSSDGDGTLREIVVANAAVGENEGQKAIGIKE